MRKTPAEQKCKVCNCTLPLSALNTRRYCASCQIERRRAYLKKRYHEVIKPANSAKKVKCKLCGVKYLAAEHNIRNYCPVCVGAFIERATNRFCLFCTKPLVTSGRHRNTFCSPECGLQGWYILKRHLNGTMS